MSWFKHARVRLGLYFGYGFAFVTYFTLAYVLWVLLWGSGGYLEYSGLQTRLAELLQSNSVKVERNQELKSEVQRFTEANPEQIDSYARTRLGLIEAEEQLVVFVEEDEEPAAAKE